MKALKTFYDECIASKIAQCDRKAKIMDRPNCSKAHAELRRTQAVFFEDRKEQLIEEMVRKNIGRDLARINAFLIESFLAFYPERAYSNDCAPAFDETKKSLHSPGLCAESSNRESL